MTHINNNKLTLNNNIPKELKNLNETDAGLKAQELDKADGKQDGKISANIWNEYAKEHGGNEIQNEISVIDAMNSITTYSVKEQTEAKKAHMEELRALAEQEPESVEPQFGL